MAGPPDHPPEWWHQHPAIVDAARRKHLGEFIRAYRHAHRPTLIQRLVGDWIGYSQSGMHSIEAKPGRDPHLVAHVLTVLGAPTEFREIWWFAATDVVPALTYHPDLAGTMTAIRSLKEDSMDPTRRSFLRSAAFSVAAATGPSRDWLLATIEQAIAGRGRVSSAEVDAIRRAWTMFSDLGLQGGGRARAQLTTYVTGHVLPLLERNDPATPVGRELFEVATEHLELLAMMAYDDNSPLLAQGYLTQGLRLAQESGSVDLGAYVLAGMALVAQDAGQHREAIQLAATGRHGLAKGHSQGCLGFLWAVEARAAATIGDHQAVTRATANGQAATAAMRLGDEPEWGRQLTDAYLDSEYALAQMEVGDPTAVEELAGASIPDALERGWHRPVVYSHTARALTALSGHNLDVAASEATAAVEYTAGMQSSRCRRHVSDLQRRLRPHSASPAVREFLETADLLLA